MKTEEVLLKDICPKWFRLSATSRLRIGAIVMAGSVLWCLAAPWLSANNEITVGHEFSSYWCAGVAFIYGAGNYLQYSKKRFIVRLARVSVLLILIIALIIESSHAFFFWKTKSIGVNHLSEVTSYLRDIGTQREERGAPVRSERWALPNAIRSLGLPEDYLGEYGKFSEYTQYTGHVADVTFGNKLRIWGVYEGSEETLNEFCQGCRRVQVGQGVYFFVGSKD